MPRNLNSNGGWAENNTISLNGFKVWLSASISHIPTQISQHKMPLIALFDGKKVFIINFAYRLSFCRNQVWLSKFGDQV